MVFPSPGILRAEVSNHRLRNESRAQISRRRTSLSSWLTFLAVCLSCGTDHSLLADQPLINAHAHNDYEHDRPLLDALEQSFCSVEADIWLVGDQLLVGHDLLDLRPGRTLQGLYLDPLVARIQAQGGRVYPDGPPFTLMIDIKSDATSTYRRLAEVLSDYGSILTEHVGPATHLRAVEVVVSGNRKWDVIAATPRRFVGIDGRISDLDTDLGCALVPWISDNWANHFGWRGDGPMPTAEREKLTAIVRKAHAAGRRVRFWATPESELVWRELVAAEVDLINTDQLARLNDFLTAHVISESTPSQNTRR